jgi:hypothetical protein
LSADIDRNAVSARATPEGEAEYFALLSRLRLTSPRVEPIRREPLIWEWSHGTGTRLVGRRDEDAETRTYVTNLALTFVYLPVLILRAYRVVARPRGVLFVGREPLSPGAQVWNAVVLVGIALGVAMAIQ